MDIVKELREISLTPAYQAEAYNLIWRAADEIERLQALAADALDIAKIAADDHYDCPVVYRRWAEAFLRASGQTENG